MFMVTILLLTFRMAVTKQLCAFDGKRSNLEKRRDFVVSDIDFAKLFKSHVYEILYDL